MTNQDIVRLKAGDRSSIVRDRALGDGVRTNFSFNKQNIVSSPALRVYVDNVLITPADYTLDAINGTIIFDIAPTTGTEVMFEYYWSVYSDDEIDQFLLEANGSTDYATARLLYAWSANAARVAMRESLSGGGGVGNVLRDTSVVAQELRATAAALMKLAEDNPKDASYIGEGLTEVIWTEFQARDAIEQEIIRTW